MLRQRVDRQERLVGAGAIPVASQLVLVNAGPFLDEPERSRRKRAFEHIDRLDLDLRHLPGIGRMECGGGWSRQYIVMTMP